MMKVQKQIFNYMYYYNFISHLYVFGLKNIEHKQPTSMFQNTPLTLIFSKLFFPLKQVCSVWEIHFFLPIIYWALFWEVKRMIHVHFCTLFGGSIWGFNNTLFFLIDITGPSNNYGLEILFLIFQILLTT